MEKKSKLQKTQDSGRRTLIAILIIGVAVYLGFTPIISIAINVLLPESWVFCSLLFFSIFLTFSNAI
jgi:hypothetical protein